jgi:hypothetical protein
MADQTPDSLVPTESPSYKRLTDADRITILPQPQSAWRKTSSPMASRGTT